MKHIAIILLLALITSCTTLEYLPNDANDVPRTLKSQSVITQQALDNCYLIGVIDYRFIIAEKYPLLLEDIDKAFEKRVSKTNSKMYPNVIHYVTGGYEK